MKFWQSMLGTKLIIHALNTTIESPSIIPFAVPSAGLEDTRDQRNPSLLNLGVMVGMVMAKVVVIMPLCGWMI
ncbi:rCG20054, partial [Rattus norvegicus]